MNCVSSKNKPTSWHFSYNLCHEREDLAGEKILGQRIQGLGFLRTWSLLGSWGRPIHRLRLNDLGRAFQLLHRMVPR